MKNDKPETFYLGWLDPRDQKIRDAGVAFYNEEYAEYFLKIDEDQGKLFYLKPIGSSGGKTHYRMELVIKRNDGTFKKRQCVGDGYSSQTTEENIHIQYGSKFATLVLYTR